MNLDRLIAALPPVLSRDVARLRPLMLRLARDVARRTNTSAEDVLQTFLLRLLLAAKRFEARCRPSTFAYAVLTNEARQAIRTAERRHVITLPPSIIATRADHMEQQLDAIRVLRGISRLPSRRRRRAAVRAARLDA